MSLIRKAMWPAALAVAFMVFLGVMGSANVRTTDAAPGDVCSIQSEGVEYLNSEDQLVIDIDESVDITAYFEDLDLLLNGPFLTDVNLDDENGDSDITSVDEDGDGDTEAINDTDHLNAVAVSDIAFACGGEVFDAVHDFIIDGIESGEDCIGPQVATTCQLPSPGDDDGGNDPQGLPFDDFDIDCGLIDVFGDDCAIPGSVIDAVAEAVAAEDVDPDCSLAAELAEDTVIDAWPTGTSSTAEFIAFQFQDYFEDACDLFGVGSLVVDVTCEEAGTFDLSFAPEDASEPGSIEVVCRGEADDAELVADPASIETVPARGNVSRSLLVLTIVDDEGEQAQAGQDVDWSTDKCTIDALEEAEFTGEEADDEDDLISIVDLFNDYESFDPDTADAINDLDGSSDGGSLTFVYDPAGPSGPDTIAAALLLCDPDDAPGIATVEAEVDDADVDASVEVTVVGPAAFLDAAASPEELICGEKATITVNATDAVGQAVSDHTVLELVTNYGGVLAGTGATLGFPGSGPVNPLSSTGAETFDGVAIAYLLTSANHVGDYEVVIAGGGSLSGTFSTPVATTQVTVTCSLPGVAPDVESPDTGTGSITPPSTGDAGLAAGSSSSAMLFVIAGAVAVAFAGIARFAFARR